MAKYLSVVLGLLAMGVGVWGIIATWPLLWTATKALVLILFVGGGVIAVLVGVAEIRDSLSQPSPPAQGESRAPTRQA